MGDKREREVGSHLALYSLSCHKGDAHDCRETTIQVRSIGCQHRPLSMVLQAIANTDMNEVFKCAWVHEWVRTSECAGEYEWVQVCMRVGMSGCGQACEWAGTNECRWANVRAGMNGCGQTCVQACKSGCKGEGVNIRQIKNKKRFNNENLSHPIVPPLACGRV